MLKAGVLLCALLPPAACAAEPVSITQLSWLAGCWERIDGEQHFEEHWMVPEGGTMLGMSRTVAAGVTREFEYMRIEEQDGRLIFTARPSGQEDASFPSAFVTPSKVVFENTAHDFPQRVIYVRTDEGSLQARIEGEMDGKSQGVDFPMLRTACPGNRL